MAVVLKICSVCLLCTTVVQGMATTFTYRSAEGVSDTRFNYDLQLMEMALSLTVDEFGDYLLQPAVVMNTSRVVKVLQSNEYENFFATLAFDRQYADKLSYVAFPVQRGIVGMRLFLSGSRGQAKLAQVQSIEDLRQLVLLQGRGWLDTKILQHNEFEVVTLSTHDSLFHFVAQNRADLLPRGVHEIDAEFEIYGQHIPGLSMDKRFAVYYPFLRFFYTNRQNEEGLKRLQLGLQKAWENGDFIGLWESHFGQAIDAAGLSQRTIFTLENPELENFPHDFSDYLHQFDD